MSLTRRTPLQRGAPLRRTELSRRTKPLRRFTPLKAKNAPKKRSRSTGPDGPTVDAVLERDHWSCVVCDEALVGDRGTDWSIHHRRRRSQGGDNSPTNLISVCGNGTLGCHGLIHARPEWARQHGWLLRGSDAA